MRDEARTKKQLINELETLRKSHETMEQKVKGRTSELLEANEQLKREITNRKRVEKRLRESEAYMKSVLKAAPIGIGLVHNRVLGWISDRMSEMLGYSESELIGNNARIVYETEEEFERVGRVKYSQIQERGMGTVETRFKCKDGSSLDVLLCSSAIDPEDLSNGVIFTALDITERKLMEGALRESEENFRALAENANDGILIASGEEGVNVYANKRAAEITGYSIGELLEIGLRELVAPDEIKRVADKYKKRLMGKKVPSQYETTLVRKSGRIFPVELSSAKSVWKGEPASIVIIRDITKRTKRETALRKSEAELLEKSRHLEEVNAALKVLLKRREEDKIELGENVVANVRQLVFPYLEKLKKSRLDTRQTTFVDILEANIKEIVSPFVTKLSSKFLNLTPAEIKIAGLVRDGRTTKEIAALLHLSENTIVFHRYNIRRKLRLRNKKVNLRSYLKSLHQ